MKMEIGFEVHHDILLPNLSNSLTLLVYMVLVYMVDPAVNGRVGLALIIGFMCSICNTSGSPMNLAIQKIK